MKKIIYLASAIAIASSPALATSIKNSSISSITQTSSAMEKEAQLILTDEERVLINQWQLKASDWVKYKQIMKGPRGIWSPGLDPITALGVSETDPDERKRYADIWMKVESRRIELELAFEVERMKAGKRLHGDKLAIDNRAWIEAWKKEQKAITHQVKLFMDVKCLEECKDLYHEVQGSVGSKGQLDIYFIGATDSQEIGQWAAEMEIDPELVRSRKITLNHDEGYSTSVGLKVSDFPAVKVVNIKTGEITDTFQEQDVQASE